MSAQSISRIWALLDQRKDNAHLLLELIGSYSLGLAKGSAAPSQSLSGTRDITRQLLVRLRVIVDHHLHWLALQDIGCNVSLSLILPKDLSFELLVHIISIASWPQAVSADAGKTQYALHRGLFFALIQTSFRCFSLYPQPLEEQDANTLLQSIHHVCQVWEDHQPLSSIESLVLRYIIPQTINELQLRTGSSSLRRFCCEGFGLDEYQQGRSPLCAEPANPHCRATSFQICQKILQTALGGLQESNWLQACWTLYDAGWALADSSVSSFLPTSPVYGGSAGSLVEAASAELWATVKNLQQSLDPETRNALLCTYFTENITRISGHNWSILPFNVPASDDLTHCVEGEILNFEAYLDARDQLLSQQYPETRTKAWVVSEPSDLIGLSPSPGPSMVSGPLPHLEPGHQRASRRPTAAATSPTAPQYPFKALPASFAGLQEPAYLGSTADTPAQDGGANLIKSGMRTGSSSQRNSASTGPKSPLHEDGGGFSPASTSRSTGTRTPWSESDVISHRVNSPRAVSHTICYRPEDAPEYATSGGYRTPNSQRGQVNHQETFSTIAPPSVYEASVGPSTKTTKSSRWGGLFSGNKSIKAPSIISQRPTISMPVLNDLGFCFSSVGSSLLLWETKNADYIVRLFWPFRHGNKLKLRSFSPNDPLEDGAGSWTVKLVEGGNALVAAVVLVNKRYKLLYFDGAEGGRHEISLPRPDLIPISLAVSRDDAMVALGCGVTIFLFSINTKEGTYHLTKEIPSHSRPRSNISHRRRQRLNFSPDSSALVSATQEPMNPNERTSGRNSNKDTQVHVCLWRFDHSDQSRVPRLEVELHDVFLSLGRGGDPGITSISVCLTPSLRIFMSALSFENYFWILALGGSGHRRMSLTERRIHSTAQSSSQAQGGNLMAFRSGPHDIVTVDLRTGVTTNPVSFAQERGNLKMGQDAMVVAFAPDDNSDNNFGNGSLAGKRSILYAFWKGWEGQLVLKQVDVGSTSTGKGEGQRAGNGAGGQGAVVAGEELQAVYWYVVSRG